MQYQFPFAYVYYRFFLTMPAAPAPAADVLAIARQVLHEEADALRDVADALAATPDFVHCVQAILQLKGRVVVTGIGKSAHIAGKIVATLNSTGTPALFMHAADAIHGDLGMIQPEDFVVAISKSGDTPEIKVLVPLLRRKGVPLAALVSNADSYLAQQATYVLHAPVAEEACPNNLAPTTSTTAALALGDALAVCLLESRQFTAADFARLHPGGTLGKRLYLKVGDLSRQNQRPQVAGRCPAPGGAAGNIGQAPRGYGRARRRRPARRHHHRRRPAPHAGQLFGPGKARGPATFSRPSPPPSTWKTLPPKPWPACSSRNITQLVVTEDGQFAGFIHLHDLLREGLV